LALLIGTGAGRPARPDVLVKTDVFERVLGIEL
jgi:hypothetical protein